jgi:hypothetical protein
MGNGEGEGMNVCGACGLDFASLNAFDAHRVGRHEPLERRCLTLEELESSERFARNAYGRFTLAKSLERGQERRRQTAQALRGKT